LRHAEGREAYPSLKQSPLTPKPVENEHFVLCHMTLITQYNCNKHTQLSQNRRTLYAPVTVICKQIIYANHTLELITQMFFLDKTREILVPSTNTLVNILFN